MKRFLLVLVSLVILATLSGCKYKERTREVGYKGEARINRFLAAERFANEMGLEASSYAGAPSLPPPQGATLIIPVESLRSVGQMQEMGDWIAEGGNLIAYLTVEKYSFSYWNPSEEERDEPFAAFLDYFDLELRIHDSEYQVPSEDDDEAEAVEPEEAVEDEEPDGGEEEDEDLFDKEERDPWGKEVRSLSFDGERAYQTKFTTPYWLVDREGLVGEGEQASVTYDYGDGQITVLGSAELFTNRSLGEAEHASALWELLSRGENDTVWLIHSTRLSFFKLLWQRAPHAVVFLVVTVFLLVWWAARGFGPKFVRGSNPSAKLDEHLEASGSFFRKHKAELNVISHQREKLLRRLARMANQPFTIDRGELLEIASRQNLLEAAEVSALTDYPSDKTLLTTLQTLKNLEQKL